MAKALVSSSRLQSDFLRKNLTAIRDGQVRTYTSGSTTRQCHVDGRIIAGLYHTVITTGYAVKVNSTNRWCDFGTASTTSSHYVRGGGVGIDLGQVTPPGGTPITLNKASVFLSSSASGKALNTFVTTFLTGAQKTKSQAENKKWEVGQGNCRAGTTDKKGTRYDDGVFGSKGYIDHWDTCDHLHVAYVGTDRTYPKPPGCSNCGTYSKVSFGTVAAGSVKSTAAQRTDARNALSASWTTANWKRVWTLAGGLPAMYPGDEFGRTNNTYALTGAKSISAQRLQEFLNNLGTIKITADGVWGPATTEKLLHEQKVHCNLGTGAQGAVDGYTSIGTRIQLSATHLNNLTKCFKTSKF